MYETENLLVYNITFMIGSVSGKYLKKKLNLILGADKVLIGWRNDLCHNWVNGSHGGSTHKWSSCHLENIRPTVTEHQPTKTSVFLLRDPNYPADLRDASYRTLPSFEN